jgi:hypothetical protein
LARRISNERMSSYTTEQATDPSIILITALFSMRRMSVQLPIPKVLLQNETQQAALSPVEETFETFHCTIRTPRLRRFRISLVFMRLKAGAI